LEFLSLTLELHTRGFGSGHYGGGASGYPDWATSTIWQSGIGAPITHASFPTVLRTYDPAVAKSKRGADVTVVGD